MMTLELHEARELDTDSAYMDNEGDLWIHSERTGWGSVAASSEGTTISHETHADPKMYGPFVQLSGQATTAIRRLLVLSDIDLDDE